MEEGDNILPPFIDKNIRQPITFIDNEEIWKPIIKENIKPIYYISSHGRVFSNGKIHFNLEKSKFLTFEISNTGYYRVNLIDKNDLPVHFSIHRLVLETFNPVNNMDKLFVNHKDGNKLNNNLYNLEWTTPVENAQHAILNGFVKWKIGNECSWSTINSDIADNIGAMIRYSEYSYSEIAKLNNTTKSIVTNIANGISWREVYIKYKLWEIRNPVKNIFSEDQKVKLFEYIKENINKYDRKYLRALCMDACNDLFNMKVTRSIHIEVMDMIYTYLDSIGEDIII